MFHVAMTKKKKKEKKKKKKRIKVGECLLLEMTVEKSTLHSHIFLTFHLYL
jgi:hypothetical protein